MTNRLKIFGERHTNTNYLSQLVFLNLDCELVEGVVPRYIRTLENLLPRSKLRDSWFLKNKAFTLGWKHGFVDLDVVAAAKEVGVVTLTKNPYSWLVSMFRRPYHQSYDKQPTFEEFLTLPWQTVGRENLDGITLSPIQLWNLKNAQYLKLAERVIHLTTESTFLDPGQVILDIAQHFSINRKSDEFVQFERSTKKRVDKDSNYYKDYYLNEKWRSELSADAISIINNEIDKELLKKFGYDLIAP